MTLKTYINRVLFERFWHAFDNDQELNPTLSFFLVTSKYYFDFKDPSEIQFITAAEVGQK